MQLGQRRDAGGDVPRSTTSLMRTTAWLMLALGTVYAVTLVPGIRPTPGYRAALDWWLNMTVDGLVILVLALRVLVSPQTCEDARRPGRFCCGLAAQQVQEKDQGPGLLLRCGKGRC